MPKPKPKKKIPLGHSTSSTALNKETDGLWWDAAKTEEDQGAAMWSTIQLLGQNHSPRHAKDAVAIGLFDGELPYWVGTMATGTPGNLGRNDNGRTNPTNIVRSVIETAASMLSKNLADVKFFTNGGEWREQRRAKNLTKYVHGGLKAANFHREQQRAFIDGCLTRARGAIKFIADHEKAKVTCARVHPRELLWNELEGDNPRSLYQTCERSKETLKQDFSDHADFIQGITARVNPVNPAYRQASGLAAHADMIQVVEGWHLPNGKKHPGRHVIMVEGKVLLSEPWTHNWFPFAFFSWDDQNDNWGGRPLCESLIPYQREVGRKLRIYRTALERAATAAGPWVEATGENKPDQMLDGGTWTPRQYKGQPPVFGAPLALGADFFEFIKFDYEKAFAEAGISMLQSQGEKPAGIDAGVALREYNDITATRQVVKGQRLERQTIDAATIFIGLSKDLYAKNPALRVLAPGTKFLEQINFADVDVEEDQYTIEGSATSALPAHFVGRVNSVVDMIKGGIIPKKDVENGMGLRLLAMPDLEKEIDLYAANKDLAQMQADEALYEGRYIAPEPQQDLAQLTLAANNNYLHSMTLRNVPRKHKQLLERLMSEAHNLQMRAQVQPSGAPMATSVLGAGAGVAGGTPADGGGVPPELAQMTPAAGQPPVVPGGPMGVGMQPPVQAPPAMPLANPAPLPVPAVPSNNPARTEMPL